MNVLPITQKQKQLLSYLYTFRFLTVSQFQNIFHHAHPNRIKLWLTDLLDKKFITRLKIEDDITKPYIYCLSQRAKYLLKDNEDYDVSFLNRLYKEKNLTPNFINHCLSLADTYLFFLTQKEKDTEIDFFAKHELLGYEYFPEELPDAYIAVEEKAETNRYFLDLFDDYTPAWALRKRVKAYLEYYENNTWQEGTENSEFPIILFVLPNERMKKHIYYFTKALLEKSFYEDITIFLTTKNKIKGNRQDIWEKVE